MEITDLKAWEMLDKLKNKEVSSREVIEAHIKRIEEVDQDINAFISLDKERALKEADLIDIKIRNKEDLGLLAGIPIGIKDNIVTKDFKTTAGSKMLENFQPPYDATVVTRIKENHGIILGKNNLDEFAMGGSNKTSYFGEVKNPLDREKVPGGSSGGSAAAVASREIPFSLASDTGGSIRQPASYCGVVGFKPTYGSISRYGLIPLSNSLDQIGIIARDVKDTVLLFNSISGHDKLDTTSIKNDTRINIDENQTKDYIKGLKIGLPREFFQEDMDQKVKSEIEKSIEIFVEAGAIVEEVSLAHIKYSPEIYMALCYGDASSNMARFDGIRYGYRADSYETLDDLYKKSRGESLGYEVKKRILLGTYLLSGNRGEEYFKKAQKLRTLLIEDFNKVFSNFDLILTPTSPHLPHELSKKKPHYRDFAESVNLGGLCGISLPCREGLPIGLQLIGDRFKDENILKAALAYEGMVK